MFLVLQEAQTQPNFKPGFVIFDDNRIENGLIKSENKKDHFSRCIFKLNTDSEETVFYPGDIKGYRFDEGKYYISQRLDSLNVDSSNTDKTFIEFLFDGIVDVFYYQDFTDHYYIRKDGNKLKELKNDKRRVSSTTPITASISQHEMELNPISYEKESKEYIGILKVYFQNSPETIKKTDYVSFNVNSLLDISEDYHKAVCPDVECINYVKKKTDIIFKFGPVAGISYSKILHL